MVLMCLARSPFRRSSNPVVFGVFGREKAITFIFLAISERCRGVSGWLVDDGRLTGQGKPSPDLDLHGGLRDHLEGRPHMVARSSLRE